VSPALLKQRRVEGIGLDVALPYSLPGIKVLGFIYHQKHLTTMGSNTVWIELITYIYSIFLRN
jgi:hypothetical protein